MSTVSNTSPIINLAAIGRLDLLHDLFGDVIIPQAVYDEITVAGAGQPGATDVAASAWITVQPVSNRTTLASLELELDRGEAAAIALALELKAVLLLDERKGRTIAARLGVTHLGLLGILVLAKERGLVSDVRPLLDDLTRIAGFWISDDLRKRVLDAAGE